jgi:hypothetical protein
VTTHLVQYSTGVASAEVAWRLVDRHGPKNVVLLTADTRKEHPDNWRFAHQVADRLGCAWTILSDGRTPMQVGRDLRVVPNNRMAVCSRVLKRELLRRHIDAVYDPSDVVVHLGYDWTEQHRIDAAAPQWAPYPVASVLAEPPLLMKEQLLDLFRQRGIAPPAMYALGYQHANCGGGCVRGGQAQWALKLRVDRPGYLQWEAEEQQIRADLGKDVAILRDRSGGGVKPLTLAVFRQQIDRQPTLFEPDDWGACGCFTADPSDLEAS